MKPGTGFFELAAGARGSPLGIEAYARGEAGMHILPNLSAFAFGEAAMDARTGPAWQAGLAVRGTF